MRPQTNYSVSFDVEVAILYSMRGVTLKILLFSISGMGAAFPQSTPNNAVEDLEKQYQQGIAYLSGKGAAKNYSEAFRCFKANAERGHAKSQYELSYCYKSGKGVELNLEESNKWCLKAADQGLPEAQNELGIRYYKAFGLPKDDVQSFKWNLMAANQGYAPAEYNVAYSLGNGVGTQKDQTQALIWLRKAAEKGNPKAQNDLGLYYRRGDVVSQDDTLATNLIRKAADQGLASAEYNLGYAYCKGKGVPTDPSEGVKWYLKSAMQGYPLAQYWLAISYIDGAGIKTDFIQAHKWLDLASESNSDAKKDIINLETRMTSGQIASAREMSRIWRQQNTAGFLSAAKPDTENPLTDANIAKEESQVASFQSGGYTFSFPIVAGWKQVKAEGGEIVFALQNKAFGSSLIFMELKNKRQFTAEEVAKTSSGLIIAARKEGYDLHSFKFKQIQFFGKNRNCMENLAGSGGDEIIVQKFIIQLKGDSVVMCQYMRPFSSEYGIDMMLALDELSNKSTIAPN